VCLENSTFYSLSVNGRRQFSDLQTRPRVHIELDKCQFRALFSTTELIYWPWTGLAAYISQCRVRWKPRNKPLNTQWKIRQWLPLQITKTHGTHGTMSYNYNEEAQTLQSWSSIRRISKWSDEMCQDIRSLDFQLLKFIGEGPFQTFGKFENASIWRFPWRGVPNFFQYFYPKRIFVSPLHYLPRFRGCWKYTCLLDHYDRDIQYYPIRDSYIYFP
jgi:hypothetical protein